MNDRVQWRSQYGANGATAPPGPPRTTYVIRANPMRYSGGEGGGGSSLRHETCGYHQVCRVFVVIARWTLENDRTYEPVRHFLMQYLLIFC